MGNGGGGLAIKYGKLVLFFFCSLCSQQEAPVLKNSNANVTPKDREGEGEALQKDMSDMSGTLPKNDLSRLYLPSPVAALSFLFFF